MAGVKELDRQALHLELLKGIKELWLDLSPDQIAQFIEYIALLSKWNAVYNLTAIRDPHKMLTQHVLDSLSVIPAFQEVKSVLDVGAGGGLPGIILAISRPQMQVSLVDTVHKKTAFLTQVKAELNLQNVHVYTGRVEQLPTSQKFEVITSRAFAELGDFVNWSEHLLQDGGQFIAMKGQVPTEEINRLPKKWKVTEIRPLSVPGLNAERHLIFIKNAASDQ